MLDEGTVIGTVNRVIDVAMEVETKGLVIWVLVEREERNQVFEEGCQAGGYWRGREWDKGDVWRGWSGLILVVGVVEFHLSFLSF